MKSLLPPSTRFTQIANTITVKVAELLHAPVYVTDEKGTVLTSSEPGTVGLPFQWIQNDTPAAHYLQVPLRHDAYIGSVVVGDSLIHEPISSRLTQVLVELVISQAAVQDALPNQQEIKNQFLYSLLHGHIEDEAVVLQQAEKLGMDLTPPRAIILIDAGNYVRSSSEADSSVPRLETRRRSHLVIGSVVNFFHLPNDTICADLGDGEVAVLKASDSKNLGSWAMGDDASAIAMSSSWANLTALRRAADALLARLRSDTGDTSINIGVGRYHPGPQGLAQSYQDARAALSLGIRLRGPNRVHCLGQLGVAAFVGVADERTKIDLARYLLSPLDHEPDLLITLDTFFSEDCSPSTTAKQLSIHRNTLSYRLDKIASLTGLDPRRFDDAVQMRLCLLLRSLQTQSA